MASASKYFGGGGGQLLNTLIGFNRFEDLIIDEAQQSWLRTGFIETDIASYPDAFSYVLGVYTGTSFSITTGNNNPKGITWDGVNFWILATGGAFQSLYRYTAAGAYDSFTFETSGLSSAVDVTFDGTDLVVIQSNTIRRYALNGTGGVSAVISNARSITWDGTYFWILDTSDQLVQYDNSFVATGITLQLIDLPPSLTSVEWDGTHFWLNGRSQMRQFTSTGQYTGSFVNTSSEGTDAESLVWDGTHMVTLEETLDEVFKYDITTDRYVGDSLGKIIDGYTAYLRIK